MRRFLLLLPVLLFGLASAAVHSFPDLRIGKGYVGPIAIDVTWADGTARPVADVTGTLRVYSTAGVLLWTKVATPAGTPGNRLVANVTALETGAVGTFVLGLDLVEGGVTDALHGQFIVEGRR